MDLKERIQGFCSVSNQDLLLSKQHYDDKTKKSWWVKWTKASEWNWIIEPTDRQIMENEIVIETDYDIIENKRLTKIFQSTLKEKNISYFTYYTGSKSFHIHFFIKDIQKYTNTYILKSIKEEVAKDIAKENYKFVDSANFNDKKLIRIEGSIHPKTKRKGTLFDKFVGNDYEINDALLSRIKKIPKNICETDDLVFEKDKKRYCYLIEEAKRRKFPEGKRNQNLLPNAVAILDNK